MTKNYDSPAAAHKPAHGGHPTPAADPRLVTGLVVRPDGTKEYVETDATLESLQQIVGGWIEYVWVTPGVHAYVNEEGRLGPNPLPVNELASRYAGRAGLGDEVALLGTVIFLSDGPDGEEASLIPQWRNL